jgi:hypothetical protein
MLSVVVIGVISLLGVNAQTADVGVFGDICNPIVAECDGNWMCSNKTTVPSYNPRYGMICQIEDGAESFSVGLSEMCPFGGSLGSNLLCNLVRPATPQCPDFTEVITDSTVTYQQCVYRYQPICPGGYAFFKEYAGCLRFEKARCFTNQTDCNKYYCTNGIEPIYLGTGSNEWPMCIMNEYEPTPSSDGKPMCTRGGYLIGGRCVVYADALYRDCDTQPSRTPEPSREAPSKSPEPSRDVPSRSPEPSREAASKSPEPSREAPSRSPEPTREAPSRSPVPSKEAASKSPEPSREQPTQSPSPCAHPYCRFPLKIGQDGMCHDIIPVDRYPFCGPVSNTFLEAYQQCGEWSLESSFSDATGCPDGFQYILVQDRQVCVRLYPAEWTPCPIGYTTSSYAGMSVCDRIEEPECGCPLVGNYTACKQAKDRYEQESEGDMCYSWFKLTSDMTDCPPEYFVVPRNDTLFCVTKYDPIYSVCPPGFMVALKQDGTRICQPIEGEPCDPEAFVEQTASVTSKPIEHPSQSPVPSRDVPSQSPVPSRDVPSQSPVPSRDVPSQSPVPSRDVPSQSPVPSRDVPSQSPEPSRGQPSETPSATPVKTPVITATIRIEINANLIQNTTSDLSVFEEPSVLLSLTDAIARALGVPIEMVIIESVGWVDNGVIVSTVQLRNTSGGRRLQAVDGFDIKYKVVNPPEELLSLPPEQFATKVEASTAVLSAAASAVSAATGVQVNANDIVVQSTEMAMLSPPSVQSQQAASKVPIGALAGGIGGGLVLIGSIVGIAVAVYYKKRAKTVKPLGRKISFSPARPMEEFKPDRVVVTNPMTGGSEPQFAVQNKNFSYSYSQKDIETAFTPRQARRSQV